MKQTLVKRLFKKLRAHRIEVGNLQLRILELERSVTQENKKAMDWSQRLHRVVRADVTREPGLPDLIRLQVQIDKKQADLSRGGFLWQEATQQLVERLRQVLSKPY